MKSSTLKTSALLLLAAGFLATQPGASCVSDSGGDNREPTRTSPSRDDSDTNTIPQRADIVREGKNELSWTADADGQLYIQDLRDEVTLLERRVTRGTTVRISPDENRIWVNDKTVSKADLKRDHTHRIYLLRDRRFEDDRRDNDRSDRDRDVESLPSGAQVMGEGRNRELSFKPSVDGRVYIYDTNRHRVVNSAAIERGQRFVFSPAAGRATIDGRRVVEQKFDSDTIYRIYFAR